MSRVLKISLKGQGALTRRSKRAIQGIIRAYNVYPINEIGGDIND